MSSHGPSCNTHSYAASPTATLYTILVEESFLVHLFASYFDSENSEIRSFTQQARFSDANFSIIHKLSVALLATEIHPDTSMQLIIP